MLSICSIGEQSYGCYPTNRNFIGQGQFSQHLFPQILFFFFKLNCYSLPQTVNNINRLPSLHKSNKMLSCSVVCLFFLFSLRANIKVAGQRVLYIYQQFLNHLLWWPTSSFLAFSKFYIISKIFLDFNKSELLIPIL